MRRSRWMTPGELAGAAMARAGNIATTAEQQFGYARMLLAAYPEALTSLDDMEAAWILDQLARNPIRHGHPLDDL